MSRGRFKMCFCLVLLAAVWAWTNVASAVVVASYTGPTTFDGIDDKIVLPNVSIGLEGSVSLEFKAHDTAGMHHLWYCCDDPDCIPGVTKGEYRINLTNNTVWAQNWPCGCSQGFGVGFPLTDTTSWHTVRLRWKEDYGIGLMFDGVEKTYPIAYENFTPCHLSEFTSTDGNHLLGAGAAHPDARYFDGEIRNLVISNTYQVPEPSVVALTITGSLGFLVYAWRRRRSRTVRLAGGNQQ
jgi:hypothetical protein